MKSRKLKPITLVNPGKYRNNVGLQEDKNKQELLLKALTVSSNPQELKKLSGLRSVAEVYRTLDKLAIRREYHEALVRQGISLDYIVEQLKSIIEGDGNERNKLFAITTFMRSLGVDEYKEQPVSGTSLEEQVAALREKEKREALPAGEVQEYEVKVPQIPAEAQSRLEIERKTGRSIYGED